MSEEKLKSCPFCGKEPVYIADGKVICVCGAMMKSFNDWKPFTNQEAIEAWNRRVPQRTWTQKVYDSFGDMGDKE